MLSLPIRRNVASHERSQMPDPRGNDRFPATGRGLPFRSFFARSSKQNVARGRVRQSGAYLKRCLGSSTWKTIEISLPVAIMVVGEDAYRLSETWARRAYPSLAYFHEVDRVVISNSG